MSMVANVAYWCASVQASADVEPLLPSEPSVRDALPLIAERRSCFEFLAAAGVPVSAVPSVSCADEDWRALPLSYHHMLGHYVGVDHLQRLITSWVEDEALTRFLVNSATPADEARLTACGVRGSGLWLVTMPNIGRQMRDFHVAIALRLRIGLPSVAGHMPAVCHCGASLARDKWHAFSCPKIRRRTITVRHDKVTNLTGAFSRSNGVPVHIEVNDYDGCRPDAEFAFCNSRVLGDVSITHPLAPSILPHASRALGAAGLRAASKVSKFGPVAAADGATFVPLILETYGGMHSAFTDLLNRIEEEMSMVAGGNEPLIRACAAISCASFRRTLAVTLQIWNAEAVAQWAGMMRNGGVVWP